MTSIVIIACVLFAALCVGAYLLLMAKLDADWRNGEGNGHDPEGEDETP